MTDMRHLTVTLLAFALCAMPEMRSSAQTPPAADAHAMTAYRATYEVFYKGRRAGSSTFSVLHNADDGSWQFVSNSRLRGIVARLVAPRPVIEDSRFVLDQGRIRPTGFHYEDGSRKGEDNYDIAFDWGTATAKIRTADGPRDFDLEIGVLDRGTSQVAIMLDAARGTIPPTYRIIDDDGIDLYEVTELDPATTTTGAGEHETRRFSEQRPGSSRATVLWIAPALRHLPVRIEQLRNGEPRTAFVLESVEFD